MTITDAPVTDRSPAPSNAEVLVAPGAAELAARIQIPRQLPPRYDGEPMRHLSNSSYMKFLLCPEDWRRHYMLGQRSAPSGAMFLGNCVDDAISAYYQRVLDANDTLKVEQVHDAYRDRWADRLAEEHQKLGVAWEQGLDEASAFDMGLQAIELSFAELIPHLGDPVAVQRQLEFAIAPGLEWTIVCYLDLETTREPESGETIRAVVDYKVKNSPITQAKANVDPQAGIYLAGRWLENQTAGEFRFAQIAKPGPRRKTMSSALITTTRTAAQLRGNLARIAQAASQIAAYYERFGPDQPWGFADPTSWKCAAKYCAHFEHACPGGAGL